jgi:ribosomal protein S18 acetylase RimI-like enzyme
VSEDILVRRAEMDDVPRLAVLGADLVRMHHTADPARFFIIDGLEAGYARWLSHEIARDGAAILVAIRGSVIVGYAYGALEGRDWKLLLDTHGAVHDIFVVEEARRSGVGRTLLDALVTTLERLGAPRIVLSTMAGNEGAQRLFRRAGFRPTMLEMTR